MSNFSLVVYYMFKEVFNPHLHHADFQELVEDVDYDVFKKTHNFKHMKYIKFLNTLNEQYQEVKKCC